MPGGLERERGAIDTNVREDYDRQHNDIHTVLDAAG